MSQADDAISAWITEHALPLTTLDPDAPLDDLAPLAEIIDNASLVGLGEASHGGHECFVLKHRLLRFLVEHMGFTIFAMEMSWMQAEAINEYVQTGIGDVRALLAQNGYWIWHTKEVLDLIEWLRAYNADPAHVQKVQFAGFDSVTPTVAGLERIVQYLQQVDPPRSAQIADRYHDLGTTSLVALPDPSVRQRWCEAAEQVLALLQGQEQAYIARSSPVEYAAVLQEARVVTQAMLRIRSADAPLDAEEIGSMAQARDHFMAENVCWLLEQAEPGTKMVLWAHNWHIGTWEAWRPTESSVIRPFTWMGSTLRDRYHDRYLSIGFSFYSGAHNAVLLDTAGQVLQRGPQAYPLPPANQESYHATLSRAGARYLFDLRSVPAGEVRTWLEGPHPFRDFGADHVEGGGYQPLSLTRWFDVLIQLEQLSPTHLLPEQ